MLVLFEGPDGAGKTTLIKKLIAEHFKDALYCKRTSWKNFNPAQSSYKENIDLDVSILYDWRFFFESLSANFINTMFFLDRSFITHKVYQLAINQSTRTPKTDDILESYEKELLRHPHLVVYTKHSKLRDEVDVEWISQKTAPAIIAEYNKYFDTNKRLNTLTINTEKHDIETSVAAILGGILACKHKYKQLRYFPETANTEPIKMLID